MVRSQSDRHPGLPPRSARFSEGSLRQCHAERSRDRGGVVLHKEPFRHVNRLPDDLFLLLFFVRVNQVLVRLWARAMEADACPCSSRCPVDV